MGNYEQISENCKIRWCENLKITNERYSQVSGYVFNNKNQLLIVKNENNWTIPGGHPELNETQIQTLKREILEEACITITNIEYLGAVEVIENKKKYYQLRYFANVLDLFPFKQEWEICERKFIDLQDLNKYIKWADGTTFKEQIKYVKKYLTQI